MTDRGDMDYELVVADDGTAVLTCGGEVLWSSDADDEFAEDFPDELIEADDREQTGELIEWLADAGYLPPGVDVTVIADDSAATGNFAAVDGDEGDEAEAE